MVPSTDVSRVEAVEQSGRRRYQAYAVYAPFLLLLVLWMWLFVAEGAFRGGPSGKAFGADFAMFVTAGKLLKDGRNPYDHSLLYRSEQSLMREQHLAMTDKRGVVRVGNPPLFFWLLGPLSSSRFQPAAYVWIAALYLLSFGGLVAILVHEQWHTRLVPSVIFLLMPQVVLGAFYGNVIGVVFAGIAAAVLIINRYPAVGGALLVVGWLKPQVALPLVLLLVLFHAASTRRAFTAFAAASIGAGLLMLVTCGWSSVAWWASGLLGYSQDMAIQPDVASLAGLFVQWAPIVVRLALEALSLALALGLTLAVWRTRDGSQDVLTATGWLWFVWLLATPYAHFFDLMLLAIPIVALLGPNGRRAVSFSGASILYLLFVSLLLINPTSFHTYLLPIPTLLAGILAFQMRTGERRTGAPTIVAQVSPTA